MRLLQRSYESAFATLTVEEAIERGTFGGNSGNLVFIEAAEKILTVPGTTVEPDRLKPRAGFAERINAEYDGIVIPLANAFRPTFQRNLRQLTRLIRRVDVPVTVLGVGAQADVDGDVEPLRALEDDVRAFVSAVLDKGPSIGVRGEFTADYLQRLGFSDVEVIGCPSMFRHGPELPALTPPPVVESAAIATNGGHALFVDQGLDRFVRRLVERFPRTTFVGQNTAEALQLRWRDVSSELSAWTQVPTHPEHPLYRAGKVRFYVDATTWIDDLRTFDYAIGGRIHGSIAALLAGTPAVVLAGDARTLELSRYFEIPHRVLRSLPEDVDPASILEEADWTPMVAGHRKRWETFAGYLRRHGLSDTFTHGDGGVAFEERIAARPHVPRLEASTLSDLEAARDHIAWLRAERAAVERELRRAAASRSVSPTSPAPRPRPAWGERLRRARTRLRV